jgi:hypothetical protein
MIPSQNFSRHSIAVDLSSFKCSSIESAAGPYANKRGAAVHFCRGERPSRPRASSLWVKYGEYSPNLSIILKKVIASCDTCAGSNLEDMHNHQRSNLDEAEHG